MAWRKWIVRGIVYGIIALCAVAVLLYQRWTNPAAVREQVMAKLNQHFPGAAVTVDSARLRILGGIQLNGLRLTRRDDPDKGEFLHVPSAVFYHDKEKILEGELLFRKVELYRPHLRVRRGKDGKWNLEGLMHQVNPNMPVPTVVIHQGTLVFEDQTDERGAAPIEVSDIDVTLINDPLPTVSVRGVAGSETLGKLHVQGTINRLTKAVGVSFKAIDVPVTTALVQRVAGKDRGPLLASLQVDARTDLTGEVAYRPGQTQPLYYDVRCQVRGGRIRHAQLPLPLDELAASLHLTSGEVRLEKLKARSGPTELSASGVARFPFVDQDFEGRLEVKHLHLCKELFQPLPEKLRNLFLSFQAHGPATIQVAVAKQEGEWVALADGSSPRVSIKPEQAGMCFVKFAYPVERVTGSLDYDFLTRHTRADLTGSAGGRPVVLRGSWKGQGPQAEADFDLTSTDVPIDDTLMNALPEKLQNLARSFRAKGLIDVKAHIRRKPGEEFRNEYHVRVHDASLFWDSFPYLLANVHGVFDIYPSHWEFHEFQATRNGGQVTISGRSTPIKAAPGGKAFGLTLEIKGQNVALDDDFRQALKPMPGLRKAWDSFNPQGRLNFTAAIKQPTGLPQDLDVVLDMNACAVEPTFFPYLMHDTSGHFHFKEQRLDLTRVRAWHGDTLVSIENGSVDIHPGGGFYADLKGLTAHDLKLDETFLQAMPRRLQAGARSLKLKQPVQLSTRLVVSQAAEPGTPADLYWEDCQIGFSKATFNLGMEVSDVTGTLACVGRYDGKQIQGIVGNLLLDKASVFKQPFHDVRADFQVRKNAPDVLLIGLRAPMFGGDVTGQARVDFNSTLRYELNLTASQIDLQEFGRFNLGPKSEISGMAIGRLHLTGQGSGLDTLEGNGSVDVPNGHLKNLPFLLDLLKFLGLHWPDRTMFEEAHAQFAIHGPRINLRRLDLLGSAISLSGKGELNLNGSDVQVDFYPTSRMELLLPPPIRPLPNAFSKGLLTIEMRGTVGGKADDLKFNKRWVPAVTEPLMNIQQRIAAELKMEKKN